MESQISAILARKNSISKELSQLSQGKLSTASDFLSERKIQHHLNKIKTSAQDAYQITLQIESTSSDNSAGTIRPTEEYTVHPDEIKRLGQGDATYVGKQNFAVDLLRFRKGGLGLTR